MSHSRWENLLNCRRLGNRSSKWESGRSPFNSDHDKIIFSGAFRRLVRKTQVHPLASNDHVHNRLTHSLEVACVGRSLGNKVGQDLGARGELPERITPNDIGDIVQASCLAHDIGNPPFGHTGEGAIRYWFDNDGKYYLGALSDDHQRDFMMFEGNAQGFRVLTTAEYHMDDGGMRLSYATLAASIKYPWTSNNANPPKALKFGVFQSELNYFEEIAEACGLHRRPEPHHYYRHPLVYLMEAADDFCYGLLDLEDGLEMGILKWEQIYAILEPLIEVRERDELKAELEHYRPGRRPAIVRGKIISRCVEAAASAFSRNISLMMEGVPEDLLSLCDSEVHQYVLEAKALAKQEVFTHKQKVQMEIGAYSVISTLLEVMCESVNELFEKENPAKMSFRAKRVIELVGINMEQSAQSLSAANAKYNALMKVIDFISGMTDNYAVYLAKQFRGVGE